MKNYILVFIAFVLFSCGSSKKHDYDYAKLQDFKDDSLLIKEGASVQLLAISGGKDNDKENVYYQQIIIKNNETGDTLTILCPLLKIPQADANTGRVYIEPNEINYEKRIADATFERKNNSMNTLLQMLGDITESENKSVDLTAYMNDRMVKNELVAVNRSLPIFKNNFKTVIGILSFNIDPR